jgi:hypothetical protein
MQPGSIPLLITPQPKLKRGRRPAAGLASLASRGPSEGFNLLTPLRYGSLFQYHVQPQEPLGSVSVEAMNSEYVNQMDGFVDRVVRDSVASAGV